MICTACNRNEVAEGRWRKLGLTTCFQCAEIAAKEEIAAKAKRTSIAYNKGPYMYVGPVETAKQNLMERVEFRRSAPTSIEQSVVVRSAVASNKAIRKQAQKPLGIYWSQGEHPPKGGTIFYDENDPALASAIRVLRYG